MRAPTYLMARICIAFFIIGSVFLASCKKDEATPAADITNADSLQHRITRADAAKLLILSINSSNGVATITYDNGDAIVALAALIKTFEIDLNAWHASFTFSNNASVTVGAAGNLNIAAGDVQVDPYGNAPLCALVKVKTPVAGKFEVIVAAKPDGVEISHRFDSVRTQVDLPVLGLYDDYENNVTVNFYSAAGNLLTSQALVLKTAAVPTHPAVTFNVNMLASSDGDIFLGGNSAPWGFDQKGHVRYYFSGGASYIYGKLANGNMIICPSQGMLSYYQTGFYEVTMLGQILKKYTVTNYQHHEIQELANGNFVVGTNSTPIVLGSSAYNEDMAEEIDRVTGESLRTFNLSQLLDPSRPALPGSVVPSDWFHLNSIYPADHDSSLIISGRSQSAIVKLDRRSGQIKWIFADHHGWNETLSPYLLTPVNDAGDEIDTDVIDFWPYGQHNVSVLPNGHIFMYDDGDYRGYYSDNTVGEDSYSRGAEYEVDDIHKTIRLVWTYDHDKNLFTRFTGSVRQFADGSRMIGYMSSSGAPADVPRIIIIDQQDKTIFDASVDPGQFYYRALKFDLFQGLK